MYFFLLATNKLRKQFYFNSIKRNNILRKKNVTKEVENFYPKSPGALKVNMTNHRKLLCLIPHFSSWIKYKQRNNKKISESSAQITPLPLQDLSPTSRDHGARNQYLRIIQQTNSRSLFKQLFWLRHDNILSASHHVTYTMLI